MDFRVKQSLGYHSEFLALSCTSILVNTSKVLNSWAMSFRNWANEMGSPRYMIGGHSLGHAEGEKRSPILFISASKYGTLITILFINSANKNISGSNRAWVTTLICLPYHVLQYLPIQVKS